MDDSMTDADDRGAGQDPGEQLISVDVRPLDNGAGAVVSVAGDVDMLTTPRLQECLTEQLSVGRPVLVLDLTRLDFLGSSGLAVLVETLEQARAKQVSLRLVCDSRPVTRPLAATGLTELFDTYTDIDSALAPS